MSKTAMKLALEALENAQANFGEWWPEAITALREALAEQKSGIKQVIELYDSPDQPAQRTWVGLTDEDKKTPDMGKYVFLNDDWIDGYKTGLEKAEAKLKEKNT